MVLLCFIYNPKLFLMDFKLTESVIAVITKDG